MSAKPENNHTLPPSARGRNVVSKPLINASTISSSAKSKPVTTGTAKHPRLQRTQSATVSTKVSTPRFAKSTSLSSPIISVGGELHFKTSNSKLTTTLPAKPEISSHSKVSSQDLTASDSKSKAISRSGSIHSAPDEEGKTAAALDPLQVAAQAYPWIYMTSTLEACFKTSEGAALNDLETRENELSKEESQLQDQRSHFEAERTITFYDELSTNTFAKIAPTIMQNFHRHGDACARVEAEALDLALHGSSNPDEEAPLQDYHDILDSLDKLYTEALDLETSIGELASSSDVTENQGDSIVPSAQSQIIGVITACLPVIRARILNISMAQELIDSAQENLSISLRMESLGLLDD